MVFPGSSFALADSGSVAGFGSAVQRYFRADSFRRSDIGAGAVELELDRAGTENAVRAPDFIRHEVSDHGALVGVGNGEIVNSVSGVVSRRSFRPNRRIVSRPGAFLDIVGIQGALGIVGRHICEGISKVVSCSGGRADCRHNVIDRFDSYIGAGAIKSNSDRGVIGFSSVDPNLFPFYRRKGNIISCTGSIEIFVIFSAGFVSQRISGWRSGLKYRRIAQIGIFNQRIGVRFIVWGTNRQIGEGCLPGRKFAPSWRCRAGSIDITVQGSIISAIKICHGFRRIVPCLAIQTEISRWARFCSSSPDFLNCDRNQTLISKITMHNGFILLV